MPGSLREVKTRITATKSTAQITKAMNMVSASKVRRAEKAFNEYKDYMQKISDLVGDLIQSNREKHPMLVERPVKKVGYIIITSDRGLAGSFNGNILKKLMEEINKSSADYIVGALGRKGFSFCEKENFTTLNKQPILIRDDVDFVDVKFFATKFIDLYKNQQIDKLVVIYNNYVNSITTETVAKTLLPIEKVEYEASNIDYEYEQGAAKTLDLILPMYVENTLFGLILNSKTSEHSARMNAMKNATDNAEEVIGQLQILYNRARQAAITGELTDIVAGASAVE